jgi:hypothetical protein
MLLDAGANINALGSEGVSLFVLGMSKLANDKATSAPVKPF